MYQFPYKKLIINGKEYIYMDSKIFHSFFLVVSDIWGIDRDIINYVNKKYLKARKHKKKRIRLKKEKLALIEMVTILLKHVEMKSDENYERMK